MKLYDALFNWLQIKVVAEARPHDQPAQDTFAFFNRMLKEDHQVEIVEILPDAAYYQVSYLVNGAKKLWRFDREVVDSLLTNIESEPKYNQ